jgi:hypothetical protein
VKTISVTAAVLALLMTSATSFAIPAKGAVKKQSADSTPNVYKIGVTGFV